MMNKNEYLNYKILFQLEMSNKIEIIFDRECEMCNGYFEDRDYGVRCSNITKKE